MIQEYIDQINKIKEEKCELFTSDITKSGTYYRLSMGIEPFSNEEKKLLSLSEEFDYIYSLAIRKANNNQLDKVQEKINRLINIKIKIEKQIANIDW